MRIIPAIDLRAGNVVRLRQGDFAHERAYAHDACALVERYLDAGADWIHIVDLDGARAGTPVQTELMSRIATTRARLQAGGGVRVRADVERLLACGVERVVVGSLAVREPATFVGWLAEFGTERICLALDFRLGADGTRRVTVDAWQSEDDADCAALLDHLVGNGLRHALSTDISRDGTRRGPNVVLYDELVARWPGVEWIASGGVRHADDVAALRATGVAACVVGTALLDGTLNLDEIASCSRVA